MNKTILTGILTSRIETRTKDNETYYYGFFKLQNQTSEIPVVFKKTCRFHSRCEENCRYQKDKPNLASGSQVKLTGTWANSQKDRPSFTCQSYEIMAEPQPPTLTSLQKEIFSLLRPSLDKKKEWAETTDFLFKKQKELQEIREISKLGDHYLQAYLLTKQVFYANYQSEHLAQASFDLSTYLQRISSELDLTKRQMISAGWKEAPC